MGNNTYLCKLDSSLVSFLKSISSGSYLYSNIDKHFFLSESSYKFAFFPVFHCKFDFFYRNYLGGAALTSSVSHYKEMLQQEML